MNTEIDKMVELNKDKLKHQSKELKQLSNEFLSDKTKGIYNYVKSIEKNNFVIYLFLFGIIFAFLTSIEFTANKFVITIVALSIIYYINDMNQVNNMSRMKELQMKMMTIDPLPKYFYMDAGIIELIFSIKEYKTYSPVLFEKLIIQLDHFLKLVLLMEKFPNDSYQLLENLHRKKKSILNILHSFIYNLPVSIHTEVKLDKTLDSMQFILNYHFERLRVENNKSYMKNTPTRNNKYYYSNRNPEGLDELISDNYNIY